MPKKNSIGSILLIVGLFLSGSLYCLIWMVWPNSVTQDITLEIHDSYIVLHPLFVFAGIATTGLNLVLIVVQFFKRFRLNIWNFTQVFALLSFGGFVFYGREVLRFGFVLLGRIMAISPDSGSWTVYPPLSNGDHLEHLTSKPSKWEGITNNLPEIILVAIGLLLIILIWKIFIRSKNTAL